MQSLLYISRSTILPGDVEDELNRIIATAVARNSACGLTGALLFTGRHFAQVIEGDSASIDRLMAKISIDPRHDKIRTVARTPLAERLFGDWSMAYFGPSQFVSRQVTRLLSDPSPVELRRGAEWLTDLLREFSAEPPIFGR